MYLGTASNDSSTILTVRNGRVTRIGPKSAPKAYLIERIAVAPHAGAPTVTFNEAFPSVAALAMTMWAFGRRVERVPTFEVSGDGTGGAL